MINWIPILITLGKTVGGVLLTMLTELLTGRFLRSLIILPFEKLAKKTTNTEDDRLVEQAKHDLHIDEEK